MTGNLLQVRVRTDFAVRLKAAVLAFVALLGAGSAGAQPRSEVRVEGEAFHPVTDPVEVAAWLRRLVGRYRFEGALQVVSDNQAYDGIANKPEGIRGKGDCVGIGTGPGVQCILNVAWQDTYYIVFPTDEEPAGVYEVPGGVSYLDPSMLLFGLDPGKSGLSYLLVDGKGLPDGGSGSIVGNRATFKTPCVNTPTLLNAMKPPVVDEKHPDRAWRSCEKAFYIDVKPDAGVVHWSIDFILNGDPFTSIQMTLRRVQPEDESTRK